MSLSIFNYYSDDQDTSFIPLLNLKLSKRLKNFNVMLQCQSIKIWTIEVVEEMIRLLPIIIFQMVRSYNWVQKNIKHQKFYLAQIKLDLNGQVCMKWSLIQSKIAILMLEKHFIVQLL